MKLRKNKNKKLIKEAMKFYPFDYGFVLSLEKQALIRMYEYFKVSRIAEGNKKKKKERARNERILLYTRQIELSNAKFYYKEANMWLSAKDAVTSIEKAYSLMEETTAYYIESISEISNDLKKLSSYRTGIEAKNKNLLGEINDILYWG